MHCTCLQNDSFSQCNEHDYDNYILTNNNYSAIFPSADKGLFPHWCEGFNPAISHNISEHLSKLHKHSVITMSPDALLNMRIKAIKRVLRKQ